MRREDSKLFVGALAEIMASRPDVSDSVNEYFKNCGETRREAIKDIVKFSNDTYREVTELMRKNADVKGFVFEIVKLVDKFDFIANATLFQIVQSLKKGQAMELIEVLDKSFENMAFFKTQIDNEDNNENNGH